MLALAHGGDLVRDLGAVECVEVGEHRRRVVDVIVKGIEGGVGVVLPRDAGRFIDFDENPRPRFSDCGNDGHLLRGAEDRKPVEAAIDLSSDRAELLAGGSIALFDVLLTDVVRERQKVPGLAHP